MGSVGRCFNYISKCNTLLCKKGATKNMLKNPCKTQNQWKQLSLFSTSTVQSMKKIHINTETDVTEIRGEYVDDPNKDKLISLDAPHEKICPLCPHRLKMDIKYTDVLVLSQFMRPDGCLLSRQVTGCCAKAQTRLGRLIHKAQRAGLMPELRPDLQDGRERTSLKSIHKWRKYNIYYED